jgi:hypothetical protein
VSLHHPCHDIDSVGSFAPCGQEHFVGFSYAGGCAKKYLQITLAFALFRFLHGFEKQVGARPSRFHFKRFPWAFPMISPEESLKYTPNYYNSIDISFVFVQGKIQFEHIDSGLTQYRQLPVLRFPRNQTPDQSFLQAARYGYALYLVLGGGGTDVGVQPAR